MDNFTLFFANAIIAVLVAIAYLVAGSAKKESYWSIWALANGAAAVALIAFMFEEELGDLFVTIAPNALLVLALSLKWWGARQFEQKRSHHFIIWGPTALFIGVCMIPAIYATYGSVYTLVNVLLAALAMAGAIEFWRARGAYPAPSRYAIVAMYAILALSFAVRAGQGALAGAEMARHIPDDLLLTIHLTVAMIHLVGSGAFALSLAYERDAARLSWLARHDPLTGLLNRGAFEEKVQALTARGGWRNSALLLIDMDHFKQINDRHGHAAGDEALKACANILTKMLPKESIITRWGGDEFVALLQDCSPGHAKVTAERISLMALLQTISSKGEPVPISVSIGVCHAGDRHADFAATMMAADAALYAAKANGRSRAELAA